MKSSFCFLLFSLAPAICSAQGKASDWPEGSAMHTGLIIKEQHDENLLQLQQKHRALIAAVQESTYKDERLILALETQQIAWLAYYPQECELIGSLTGAGGSWPSTYAMRCQSNLVSQRLQRLTTAMRCIKKILPENRGYEQSQCLYQLAPLAGMSNK